MKKFIRSLFSCVIVIAMIIPFSLNASAAVGSEGYAVYNNNVLQWGNTSVNWHTAIMYDRTRTYSSLPVVHHPGSGYATFASWAAFMGGTETSSQYMGSYRPKAGIGSVGRDDVRSMSARIASDQVLYNFGGQMYANNSVLDTKYTIAPSDITHMRCDGVVEYCYEYYSYRIYGNDSYWNISRATVYHHNHHLGFVVTPYIQATQCMTKVSSVLP